MVSLVGTESALDALVAVSMALVWLDASGIDGTTVISLLGCETGALDTSAIDKLPLLSLLGSDGLSVSGALVGLGTSIIGKPGLLSLVTIEGLSVSAALVGLGTSIIDKLAGTSDKAVLSEMDAGFVSDSDSDSDVSTTLENGADLSK